MKTKYWSSSGPDIFVVMTNSSGTFGIQGISGAASSISITSPATITVGGNGNLSIGAQGMQGIYPQNVGAAASWTGSGVTFGGATGIGQGLMWDPMTNSWIYRPQTLSGAGTLDSYDFSSWGVPLCTKTYNSAFYKTLIQSKNYGMISSLADHALKTDRKVFQKMEKVIIDSNDFGIISNYIKQVNSIDVKHMTSALIKAYDVADMAQKNVYLTSYLGEIYAKLDLRQLVKHASKTGSNDCLQWLIPTQFRSGFTSEVLTSMFKEQKVNFKQIEAVFLKGTDPSILYSFTKCFPTSDRKKFFNRIRQLGAKDWLKSFIEEIDEEWVKALRNMK